MDLKDILALSFSGAALLGVLINMLQYRMSKNFANFGVLFQHLESPPVREARRFLMRKFYRDEKDWTPPKWEEWEKDEDAKKHAAEALAAYSMLSVVLDLKQIDRKTVIRHWGHSIYRITLLCTEFIRKRQEQEGPGYFHDLIELAKRAQRQLRLGDQSLKLL